MSNNRLLVLAYGTLTASVFAFGPGESGPSFEDPGFYGPAVGRGAWYHEMGFTGMGPKMGRGSVKGPGAWQ